jgi:putative transposase
MACFSPKGQALRVSSQAPPAFRPGEVWVIQQARNVTMWLNDHGMYPSQVSDQRPRYQVHPPVRFDAFWNRDGVRCIGIPPKAPQANAFCESFIGT